MGQVITIPFKPRDYQLPLLEALDSGKYKRAVVTWHRRAGKDIALWNLIIKKAITEKGLYYYFLPTFTQSKKIVWDGINNDGFRFIDYIPKEAIEGKNGTELKITLKNGSIIQLIGTDTYDSIRGTNPRGCVFSEYAFQNPMAWEVVKPILKVNGGWAVFNSTPNGKNHFYELFEMAKENEDWFQEKLTIQDTGLLTSQDMEDEKKEGMTLDMIQQEYYCSFDIGTIGNYYGDQLKEATQEARICRVTHEKGKLVSVYADLGKSDSTALIFVQRQGKEIRVIDYVEDNGKEISYYTTLMHDKPYQYSFVYLPHDGFANRLESPKTVADQFKEADFTVKRVPNHTIGNGINEVRRIFKDCWFDKENTQELISALSHYHKEWDEKKKVFKPYPRHDWSSHGADAMRYLAIAQQDLIPDDYAKEALAFAEMGSDKVKVHSELGVKADEYREYEQAIRAKYLD